MRIYISADIEGVAGVVSREQLGPAGFDYDHARRLMTDEVKAAIGGARKGGATEFVVSDSHGNGQNLYIDEFDADTTVVRSWPRSLSMMAGIEEGTYAGFFFLGYHSGVDNPRGCLAHTMNSRVLSSIKLNGQTACEAYINAAIGGAYDAPLLLATGDDAFIAEISETVAPAHAIVSKWTLGTTSARCKSPAVVQSEIEAAATAAVEGAANATPFTLPAPITAELTMTSRLSVELLETLPFIERTGALTVRFQSEDIKALSNLLVFILGYQPNL